MDKINDTKKMDKASVIASVCSFIVGLFFTATEVLNIGIWSVATIMTIYAAKKKNARVILNVVLLVITLIGIVYMFWWLHLSPNHEHITVEFEW